MKGGYWYLYVYLPPLISSTDYLSKHVYAAGLK
jgi:hypothetical protein